MGAEITISEVRGDVRTAIANRMVKKLQDAVHQVSRWHDYMEKEGLSKETDSERVEIPIQSTENDSAVFVGKGQNATLSSSQILTTHYADRKYCLSTFEFDKWDELANKGNSTVIKLYGARLYGAMQAARTLWRRRTWLFSEGANDPLPLPVIMASSPATGTVQGVDRSTNSWFRPIQIDSTASTVAGQWSELQDGLMRLRRNVSAGERYWAVCDEGTWRNFSASGYNITRIPNQSRGITYGFPDGGVEVEGGLRLMHDFMVPDAQNQLQRDSGATTGTIYIASNDAIYIDFLQGAKLAMFEPRVKEALSTIKVFLIGLAVQHVVLNERDTCSIENLTLGLTA